jgi:hypothetical protein
MQVRPIVVLKGSATFIPGMMRFACGGSGGTNSTRYCYSTWLRHLVRLNDAGISTRFESVAELGPGDSLGIGLSAMLTGAARYFALDAIAHARTASNLRTLDDLVKLFDAREDIPANDEFPEIWPPIRSTRFPHALLDDSRLSQTMNAQRVDAIRRVVADGHSDGVELRYVAPWNDASIVEPGSVDLVFSQAVLEHVEDIDATYDALFRWLKPGGVMSHQIDFRSHLLTRDWFGHWTLPMWLWRLVKGRRPYLINRLAASAHLDSMRRHGFEIVQQVPQTAPPPDRKELASEFRGLTEDDLRTSSLYLIARKPVSATRT